MSVICEIMNINVDFRISVNASLAYFFKNTKIRVLKDMIVFIEIGLHVQGAVRQLLIQTSVFSTCILSRDE